MLKQKLLKHKQRYVQAAKLKKECVNNEIHEQTSEPNQARNTFKLKYGFPSLLAK